MFHGEAENALEVKQPRVAEPGYIYLTVPQQSLDVEMKPWALKPHISTVNPPILATFRTGGIKIGTQYTVNSM